MSAPIYGLLGRTLGHSYSVQVHAALGNPAYRLIELEPDELPGFLARGDIGGLNVTMPYKRAVMPYLHDMTASARMIGSVNTIYRRGDKLIGDNTDIGGLRYLAARAGVALAGKRVLVFGSGGASQTVRALCVEAGAADVAVVSRSGALHYGNLAAQRDAEVLINTTPLGMSPDEDGAPCDVGDFPACLGALDLVYNPLRTNFILRARALGIPCGGGLAMLVEQARLAEERFTGRAIDPTYTETILRDLRLQSENIVLVGMPGCGKSTVARILAARTGRALIDTDELIVRSAGRPVEDILRNDGEAAFRALERACVAEAGHARGAIIATGGGVPLDPRNKPPLARNGRIYHIERETALLDTRGRPLSERADLAAMAKNRAPAYASFRDIAVKNDATPDIAADRVWRDFVETAGD